MAKAKFERTKPHVNVGTIDMFNAKPRLQPSPWLWQHLAEQLPPNTERRQGSGGGRGENQHLSLSTNRSRHPMWTAPGT